MVPYGLTSHMYHKHSFTKYKNGSPSSADTPNDTNMFMYYKNFGSEDMEIHIVIAVIENQLLKFKEEINSAN